MPLPAHSLSGRRGERGEPSERDERFILDPFSFPIRFPICSHSSRVNCIEKKGLFPVLPISSLSFPSLSPFTYLEEISGEMKKQSIHPSHLPLTSRPPFLQMSKIHHQGFFFLCSYQILVYGILQKIEDEKDWAVFSRMM